MLFRSDNLLEVRGNGLYAKGSPVKAKVPVALNSGNGYSQVLKGPSGSGVTVRDGGSCVAFIGVCESMVNGDGSSDYTLSTNIPFAGDATFV